MTGQTISHSRILNKLCKGGMCTVSLAQRTLPCRSVAIRTRNISFCA